MKLTIWGARGSIPVSGPQYIRYGGDTTCLGLETAGGDMVILDAGTGLRALGNKLLAEGRREVHFLFTHAHWDHLLGFPFFKPLYQAGTALRFHGCTCAQESVRTILKETMRPPFFPVDLGDVAATLVFDDECRDTFSFAGLECRSIPISHPNQGYGFRLSEGNRSVAFFPDNELAFIHPGGKTPDEYARFLSGVDLLFHDGEYLPEEYERFARSWGHSVYLDALRLAEEARAGRIVLWHLNQERSDDEVDAILWSAEERLAAARSKIACAMARTGATFEV